MSFLSQHITGISWQPFCLPLKNPYVTSAGQAISRHGLVLSIKTDADFTGIGEASPVGPGTPKQIEDTVSALASAAPHLMGIGIDSAIETMGALGLPGCLRFGIETACLDAEGMARGRPIAGLLGAVPARLPCNALISSASAAQAEDLTRQALEDGFKTLKLKIGGSTLAEDEALVSAVRQAAPQVKLRLDPNQAWDVAQAVESIKRLARYSIEYVEQPVRANDIAALAEVRRRVPVPIAADESLNSPENLHRVLDARAADVFILKAAQLGGVFTTLVAAREVLKCGATVVVTTSLESGIGIAASAHMACALGVNETAQGLATGLLFQKDIISPPLCPVNGYLTTPGGPGLGVRLDEGIQAPPD